MIEVFFGFVTFLACMLLVTYLAENVGEKLSARMFGALAWFAGGVTVTTISFQLVPDFAEHWRHRINGCEVEVLGCPWGPDTEINGRDFQIRTFMVEGDGDAKRPVVVLKIEGRCYCVCPVEDGKLVVEHWFKGNPVDADEAILDFTKAK